MAQGELNTHPISLEPILEILSYACIYTVAKHLLIKHLQNSEL